MSEARTLKQQLQSWHNQLRDERRTFHNYWQDVKDYILPEHGRFITSESESEVNDGKRKDYKILNSVATDALEVMANGMQSGLTSKARPWLTLSCPVKAINNLPHVQEWLKNTTDTVMRICAGSNIYNTLLSVYKEAGAFGTGAMSILEHPSKTIYSKPYTIGTYWVSTNEFMEMDGFFSITYMTVKQVVQKFGIEHVCENTKRAFENKHFTNKVKVVEAIIANPEKLGFKVPNGMPIAAVYYEDSSDDDKKLLAVKGFRTWPVQVVRWDAVDNDTYGYSPTRKLLGDVMGIQKMERDKKQAIAKLVSPPLQGPSEMERQGINASPGGYNAVNNMNSSRPAISPLYQIKPDVQNVQFAINEDSNRVREGFFYNLFMSIRSADSNRKTMTATEVASRDNEAFLILGPVIERIDYELLDNGVDRIIQCCYSAGLIGETPREIIDAGLKFEYTSILSQAQKAVATAKIKEVTGFIGQIATVWPQAKNMLKVYKTGMEYGEAVGEVSILNTEEEFNRINAEENRMLQMQEEAKMSKDLADAGKVVSETDPNQLQQTVSSITGAGMY